MRRATSTKNRRGLAAFNQRIVLNVAWRFTRSMVGLDVTQDFALSDGAAFAALLQNGERLVGTSVLLRLLASLVAALGASIQCSAALQAICLAFAGT